MSLANGASASASGFPPASRPVPQKLAIVGLGPTSLNYIQNIDACGDRYKMFDETWTFNSYASVIESDRLFHMDDVLVQERRAAAGNLRVGNMLEAMKRYKGPIYTSFADPRFPTMISYPLAEVAAKYNSLYFSTTPPYALALAGYLGVPEVYLYGCDYTWPEIAGAEHGRACMEYWVGLMSGQGMRVHVYPGSSLCDARLQSFDDVRPYGYDRVHMKLIADENDPNLLRLLTKEKELPTAEEIEKRYSHLVPGSGIQVDVVN